MNKAYVFFLAPVSKGKMFVTCLAFRGEGIDKQQT